MGKKSDFVLGPDFHRQYIAFFLVVERLLGGNRSDCGIFFGGGVYLFLNDLVDVKADQAHPFKRLRPIAAGRISKSLAITVFLVAAGIGLGWAKSLNLLYFW